MTNVAVLTMKISIPIIMALLITMPLSGYAQDIIKLAKKDSGNFKRETYPHALLNAALNKTLAKYGKFKIEYTIKVARDRALRELKKGALINVHEAPTKVSWEKEVNAVYFPIRKGLLGYRLFLINGKKQASLDGVKSISDLKKLRAGLGSQWSTTVAMRQLKFNVVTGPSYGGLFNMLIKNRFDYFPRGINEIFGEMDNRSKELPGLKIEPKLALYLKTPTYFFVSPKEKRLHTRIGDGLHMMKKDGEFDELFLKYHKDYLIKADLRNRLLLTVENPAIPTPSKQLDASYWIDPLKF